MTKLLVILNFLLNISSVALAAPGEVVTTDTAHNPISKQKSTDVNFDELLIQGQYHFSDEAVVTVEQDKALNALLTVRKDFKDRIKQSANRD